MKHVIAALLLLPSPLLAQGILEGTWKEDITTAKYVGPPTIVLLTDKTYRCISCIPPYEVPADGKPHAIAGHPYYDSFAISIIDSRTVRDTAFRAGKEVFKDTITLSDDGRTMKDLYTQTAANGTAPFIATMNSARLAAAPPGAHPYSGSWQFGETSAVSSNGATIMMKHRGNLFTETSMTGQSYTATIGGPPGPAIGNPGITSVAIRQTGPRAFQETARFHDQVVLLVTLTVSQDGRTMDVVFDDKKYGGVTRWTQRKQ